jgi:DNA-binding NarL/FixJ family response regulator
MGEEHLIRVLVLEDHVVVGDGVASALEATGGFVSDGVVGSIAAVQAHLAARPGCPPDVIVADIDLDGEYALGLPDLLGPTGPRVVFLSGHDEPSIIRAAVGSGAAGLVHKRAPTAALAVAIRRAVAGESTFAVAALAWPAPPWPRRRHGSARCCAGS